MAGFDDPGLFFSDNFDITGDGEGGNNERLQAKRRFKDFIREFHEGDFRYPYRDQLRHNYNLNCYYLEVDVDDIRCYDEDLADKITKQPIEFIPLFEEAATEVADEVTRPRPKGCEQLEDVQIMLRMGANPCSLRDLKAHQMSKLVKICGIVISASGIRAKATRLTIQCRSCRTFVNDIPVKLGLDGYALPRKCNTEQAAGRPKCPLDPFYIVPDKCKCVDFQLIKVQESPDSIPHGELPRHVQLYCDRWLCERVVPGNRVTIVGIYSIKQTKKPSVRVKEKTNIGIRQPYIRVLGIELDNVGPGRVGSMPITSKEEETFRQLASSPDIYETIAKSVAPSIWGSIDIKKAVACLLFGGSRKRLPDGLTRRGDVNVLLLGDPGTAKSQLLKFVERSAPIAVYTSGKGSSAAGLTASVNRDPASRNFIMEGGAMVLADGGVVCIDEFDKMKEDDRVAIHEAMEQQTISIAKAGITTTLNTRCAVFAAANSVYGRWDDTKGEQNIDFMPTILSRFDMIFVVKDEHNEQRDTLLAKHVMSVHMNAASSADETSTEGEIDLQTLKKYVNYCRNKCGPRLSRDAAEILKNRYVTWRNGAGEHERETGKRVAIPITVRQLEAIVRVSESLAKMRLASFATEQDVEEACRLFQVSTLEAAVSGNLAGAEGFTTPEEQENLNQIERQIKRRFVVGSQVSEHAIVSEFERQKYSRQAIYKVLQCMLRRGEVQHRLQRRMLYRIK